MNIDDAERLSLEVEKICPHCGKKMLLVQFKRNTSIIQGIPAFESIWVCQACAVEWTIKIWVE